MLAFPGDGETTLTNRQAMNVPKDAHIFKRQSSEWQGKSRGMK